MEVAVSAGDDGIAHRDDAVDASRFDGAHLWEIPALPDVIGRSRHPSPFRPTGRFPPLLGQHAKPRITQNHQRLSRKTTTSITASAVFMDACAIGQTEKAEDLEGWRGRKPFRCSGDVARFDESAIPAVPIKRGLASVLPTLDRNVESQRTRAAELLAICRASSPAAGRTNDEAQRTAVSWKKCSVP